MAKSKIVEKADPSIKKAEDAKKKEAERLERIKKEEAAKNAARKGGDILDFLPIRSIENGLITFTTGRYG